MKNAKLVLFAMFIFSPLCMNAMDEPGMKKDVFNDKKVFSYRTQDGRTLSMTSADIDLVRQGFVSIDEANEAVELAALGNGFVSAQDAQEKKLQAIENAVRSAKLAHHNNNAKKLAMVSGLSALGLVGSMAAQHYGKLGKDATTTQVQFALLGSSVTTGALAANEARKAHSDYLASFFPTQSISSLPTSLWNLVFGAAKAPEAKSTSAAVASSLNLNDFDTKEAEVTESTTPKKDTATCFNAKNFGYTAAVLGITTAGTYAAQHYAKDNTIVKNPNFVRVQLGLLATTVLSASAAVAQSEYPAKCWKSVFGEKKSE